MIWVEWNLRAIGPGLIATGRSLPQVDLQQLLFRHQSPFEMPALTQAQSSWYKAADSQ